LSLNFAVTQDDFLGASPKITATQLFSGSGFSGFRYRSILCFAKDASRPYNPLRLYRVWVVPQAQPHSGKPQSGLCRILTRFPKLRMEEQAGGFYAAYNFYRTRGMSVLLQMHKQMSCKSDTL
jgi:hypothetical protein